MSNHPTLADIEREIAAAQTHCYTCSKELGNVRYECPTCHELCCSDECRQKHITAMSEV